MMMNVYKLSKEESNKINLLKIIFIVLVVYQHAYDTSINFTDGEIIYNFPDWLSSLEYMISMIIGKCGVPGFFFLSSILLYRKKFVWVQNIKKKVQSLIVPYVLVNSFWIIFFVIMQQIPQLSPFFSNPDNIVKNWGVYGWSNAYLGVSGFPFLIPLWFMRDLFVLNLLSKVIKSVIDKFPRVTLTLLILLWVSGVPTGILFLNHQALTFWGLGYLVVKYDIHLTKIKEFKYYPVMLFYAGLTVLDLLTNNMSFNVVIHQICLLMGVYQWILLASRDWNKRIENYLYKLSKYSIGIYLFHEMNLNIVKKVAVRYLPDWPIFFLFEYALIPILIIVCCIVFCKLFHNVWPKGYLLVSGNRSTS